MKKKLLNNVWLCSMLAFVICGLTACDEDRDSNPTLDLSHVSELFPLNLPANAANNTYDLANANSLTITCSQPDYGGVPYVVRYYVQVARDAAFLNDTTVAHKELATSYTTAKIAIDALELNNAVVGLFQETNPDTDYPNEAVPVYIRLRAVLDGTNGLGQTYSNIITLPSVLATYVAPAAEFPETLFVVGSSIGNAWSTWQPVPTVYGFNGKGSTIAEYYTIVYLPAGGEFKWGTFANDWRGDKRLTQITDNAGSGVKKNDGDEDGNMKADKAGWYVLHFTGEMVGNSIQYSLKIEEGHVYLMGSVMGYTDNWIDEDPEAECVAPADQTGQFVSPAFKGGGELRAYIKVPGFDWWRTEFTLYKGSAVYYRDFDIPASWADGAANKADPPKADPDNYSVQCAAGQKLYVSFDTQTGEVK